MSQYRELLREVRKNRGTLREERTTPLKRRKKRKRTIEENGLSPPKQETDTNQDKNPITVQHLIPEPIVLDDSETNDNTRSHETDSDVTEVKPQVFLNTENKMDLKYEPVDSVETTKLEMSNSGEEFDSDEFENVDLESESLQLDLEPKKSDNITVSIRQPVATKKVKRNVNIISREEKSYRKSFHISTIAAMACHGLIRNHWINDEDLLQHLRKSVPRDIIRNLHNCLKDDPDSDMSFTEKQIHSRKLLDCVKQLMEFWNHDFKVNKDVGIYKKTWSEIESDEKSKPTSRQRFQNRIIKKRGSRDVAAQGFVSLLRAVKLHARLVFSLQPPDFTDNTKAEEKKSRSSSPSHKPRPQTPTRNLKGLRPGEKLLQQFRNKKVTYEETSLGSQSIDNESEFPVFWAEVWDKFSKKWISVDAICFKYIEVVRVISKFEPPSTDERNNTIYVLGYDNDGAVRDITRRYSKNYNAKTRKKRITREPKGELFYNNLINLLNSEIGRLESGIDIKELEYFNRKSLQEGMPNSIQDFKNHPVYVLEDQLKSNEIIFPKTPCGRTRKKNSKTTETIPVYKRENVHTVRSAKAWYMRGRILKPGERPMLVKSNAKTQTKFRYDDDLFGDDDFENANDEDTDKRLYAESQTELYIPPLVVDGEVPKNAFGNIDLYVPSMLPANAIYRDSKFALKAAKSLGIDYAEACVGFEFSKGGTTTAKMKGIVVAKEYEDAISQVERHLQFEEEERLKRRLELNALRGWRLLLTKLRIRDDLNKKYGNIDGIDEVAELQFKKVEEQFSKISKADYDYNSEDDELYGKYYDSTPSNELDEDSDDGGGGGGFIPEEVSLTSREREESYPLEKETDYEDNARGGYYFDEAEDQGVDDEEIGEGGGGFILDDANEGDVVDESFKPNDLSEPVIEESKPEASVRIHETTNNTVLENDNDANIDDDNYIYDPLLQQALLQQNRKNQESEKLSNTAGPNDDDDDDDDLYTTSKLTTTEAETKDNNSNVVIKDGNHNDDDEDDGNESMDSLELANKDIEEGEEEEALGDDDNEYYDDNEFEYSDDE